MRLSNVERGNRFSARLLYASCARSPASGHLIGADPAIQVASLDGPIRRTRKPSSGSLGRSVGERELFAAFVSRMNQCHF